MSRDTFTQVLAAFALLTLMGFLGACGDGNNQQRDGGATDRPLTDVPQQDAAQPDAAPQDGAPQDAPQQDTGPTNPPGTVIVVQVSPQRTGNPQIDQQIAWMKFAFVSPDWDPVNNDQAADIPVAYVDKRNPLGIGCYAKYYKKGQVLDGGLVSDYRPSTSHAGEVTVTGYTGGAYIVGVDPDAGTPVTVPMANEIKCNRFEIMQWDTDAGIPTDAGTGRYEYLCDNTPAGYGGPTAPVTNFLTPNTDKLKITGSGGTDVAPFTKDNLGVAPFITVVPDGVLWSLPALVALGTDAGVPLNYHCGVTDAGPQDCGAGKAIAIQITWGDVATPPDFMGTPPWNTERGKIVCSGMGSDFARQFVIPWEVWNTAFPPGANWKTIQAFVTHLSVTFGNTIFGAGGGQIGMTHKPN